MTVAACTSTFDAARAPIVIGAIVAAAQPHAVGRRRRAPRPHDAARLQVVPLDEAQEFADPDR